MALFEIDDNGLSFWYRYCTKFFVTCPIFKQLMNSESTAIRNGDIFCISGKCNSGKTLILHHLVAELISPDEIGGQNIGVVYLDADYSFDFNFLLRLINGMQRMGSSSTDRINVDYNQKANSNLYYKTVDCPKHLNAIVKNLTNLLISHPNIRFIILDSLTFWPNNTPENFFEDRNASAIKKKQRARNNEENKSNDVSTGITQIFRTLIELQKNFNFVFVYTKEILIHEVNHFGQFYRLSALLPFFSINLSAEKYDEQTPLLFDDPKTKQVPNADTQFSKPNVISFETVHKHFRGSENSNNSVTLTFTFPKYPLDDLKDNWISKIQDSSIKFTSNRRVFKLILYDADLPISPKIHQKVKDYYDTGIFSFPTYISCIFSFPREKKSCDKPSDNPYLKGDTTSDVKVNFFAIIREGYIVPIKAAYHEMQLVRSRRQDSILFT